MTPVCGPTPPPQETDFALLWQLVNVFFFAFIQIQSQ